MSAIHQENRFLMTKVADDKGNLLHISLPQRFPASREKAVSRQPIYRRLHVGQLYAGRPYLPYADLLLTDNLIQKRQNSILNIYIFKTIIHIVICDT